MSELSNRTLTILSVSHAQDELLCRAVIQAVENGATEKEWLEVMRATRKLMAAQFFETVDHFEAQVSENPEAQMVRQIWNNRTAP